MIRFPKGIYAVAVLFFVAGEFTVAQLLPYVFVPFGWRLDAPLIRQAGFERVLAAAVIGSIVVLGGVYSLIRLYAVPQWLFVAMTANVVWQMVSIPATGSPFHTRDEILFNRALLLLPFLAACAYLWRPSFRAACRERRSGGAIVATDEHMKKMCLLFAALLFATGVSAQSKPSFAGVWTLDAPSGSGAALGAAPEKLTLQQNAETLTVQENVGDKTEATIYRLDGKSQKVTWSVGPAKDRQKTEAVATTRWQGARLVTTFRLDASGKAKPVEFTEQRSLDRKGQMVVETSMRGGTGRFTAVYKKTE